MVDGALSKKALLTLSILASAAAWGQEPCDSCGWAERGDRWEGVIEKEQISGGSFELVSVQYRRPPEPADGSDRLHLVFWLPEPLELDEVKVWQPDRFYSMEPSRKRYGKDRQVFAWPRGEVVDRLGLAIGSLYTRIRSGTVYYPALLSTREDPTTTAGYELVFQSGAGIDATCTIARHRLSPPRSPQGDGDVIRSFECFEEAGGTIMIEWDGRDAQGRTAPAGVYVLKIDGEMLAETLRPLRQRYSFWHRGDGKE